ncbi:MAG: DUF3046 domain-containing protein [Actinomycetales bacterium]
MRASEFWELMREEFGAGYAATLAREHVVSALGERTAQEALAAGVDARDVWLALCADLDVPRERWFGRDDPAKRARARRVE